ncbi:hypothetical protein FQN50_007922 [Emmonsiellopsis sp. PD_5]|nr:hypothetical protein FQN50_007922 [Emmonsiellopsis sp. PD_5]
MDPSQQQHQQQPVGAHAPAPGQPQPAYGYPPYGQGQYQYPPASGAPPPAAAPYPPATGAPGQPPAAPGQYQYPPTTGAPPAAYPAATGAPGQPPAAAAPGQYQYPPQGYYPPPQGQYPPQQGYNPYAPAPVPGQPPQQPVGAVPVPGQPPAPYPPAGAYGAPPAAAVAGYPAAGYPGYPTGYPAAPAPAPILTPSPGYDETALPTVPGNLTEEAKKLKKALTGFNTDEDKLISILTRLTAPEMALLRKTYRHEIGKSLEDVVADRVSRNFGEVLLALVRGPLMNDVIIAGMALTNTGESGGGEVWWLNDAVLGRSNADLRAIKSAFKNRYGVEISTRVARNGQITGPLSKFYQAVLKAEKPEEYLPVDPGLVESDVGKFLAAPKKMDAGPAEDELATLLGMRSEAHLRAVAVAWDAKHGNGGVSFEKKVAAIWAADGRKNMKRAALCVVRAAVHRGVAEARLLRKTMKGMGTRDTLLIRRVVRVHWDRARVAAVKTAYRSKFGIGLVEEVKKETSGDYEKALVACLEG